MTGERSGQQKTPVDVRVSIVARSFAQPAEPERLYTSEVRASWHPVAGIHEASAIRMGFTSDLIGQQRLDLCIEMGQEFGVAEHRFGP